MIAPSTTDPDGSVTFPAILPKLASPPPWHKPGMAKNRTVNTTSNPFRNEFHLISHPLTADFSNLQVYMTTTRQVSRSFFLVCMQRFDLKQAPPSSLSNRC